MRRVLEHRPPEEEAGREVARVLEVEQARLMAECRVVGGGQMPGGIRREPQRQRDCRMREQANESATTEADGEPGGHAEHDERRRPLREDDVLEQMGAEQRRRREGVERRGGGCEHEQQSAAEAREPPARDDLSAHADRVGARQRGDDEELVRREVPPDRVHAGYRGSERKRA